MNPINDETPEYAKTRHALQHILGVGNVCMRAVRNLPGNPGKDPKKGWHVRGWRDHILRHKPGYQGGVVDPVDGQDYAARMARGRLEKLEAEAAKIKLSNEIKRGEYIARARLGHLLGRALAEFDGTWNQAIDSELPAILEGLPAIKIREKLRDVRDKAKRRLAAKVAKIEAK